MFPVYIPSKGRWNTTTTPALVEREHLPYTLVVEPHEFPQYRHHFQQASIEVLPESEQGVAYVRNFILEHARSLGLSWYWMIDDDITQFYRREGTKQLKASIRVLEEAEAEFTPLENLAQATIARKNRSIATSQFTWNIGCAGCVCNHADRLGIYRPHVQEDTDMSLQVLMAGYCTVRCNHYALATPGHGKNAGGLQEVYRRNIIAQWSQNLSDLWGKDLVWVQQDAHGELGASVDWKRFRRRG